MQPRIDLSKSSRFTVWEGGGWSDTKNFGSGLLVAGPNGEKLPVIFDTNPQANVFQCGFMAEIGQVLVEAFVKPADTPIDGKNLVVNLEIARIESLTTTLVQGEAKPQIVLKTLFTHRTLATKDTAEEVSDAYQKDEDFYREAYHDLLELAIEKSLTRPPQQKIFWGIPRVRNA